MIQYDPLGAVLEWFRSLAGILTDPNSPFWWPTLVAILVGMGIVAVTTGASWREVRREALGGDPRRFLRQLPSDLGFMLASSAVPFVAAPVLLVFSAFGVFCGMRLLAPIFGLPPEGSVLEDPAGMVLCALVAFLAGDFALYWSHRLFHRFPVLWRAHQLHHAPETLNPMTGFRFWPHEQLAHLTAAAFLSNFGMGMMAAILGTGITIYTLLGVNVFVLA
ncbi:MAG TPA: sterol desaturase family protein, partial [Acetobacteraceae bacterium]|nr:sterol desaturase family protein [Acetobacteraceae bacterium]